MQISKHCTLMPSYVIVVVDVMDTAVLSVLALYSSERADAELERVTPSTGADWRGSMGLATTAVTANRMANLAKSGIFLVVVRGVGRR